jgi:hypothetical protein
MSQTNVEIVRGVYEAFHPTAHPVEIGRDAEA